MFVIKGDITILEDDTYKCVMVRLSRASAPEFLTFLTGLELERVTAFQIKEDDKIITFSRKTGIHMEVMLSGDRGSFSFSENDILLLKCCCLDAVLNSYDSPHVDLESSMFDFTIGF